jgi:hypothetical protein
MSKNTGLEAPEAKEAGGRTPIKKDRGKIGFQGVGRQPD